MVPYLLKGLPVIKSQTGFWDHSTLSCLVSFKCCSRTYIFLFDRGIFSQICGDESHETCREQVLIKFKAQKRRGNPTPPTHNVSHLFKKSIFRTININALCYVHNSITSTPFTSHYHPKKKKKSNLNKK